MKYNAGYHDGRLGRYQNQDHEPYYVMGHIEGKNDAEAGLPHGTSKAAWDRSRARMKEAA